MNIVILHVKNLEYKDEIIGTNDDIVSNNFIKFVDVFVSSFFSSIAKMVKGLIKRFIN